MIMRRVVPDFALPLATLLPHSATPYLALIFAGFAVGILGHLSTSRRLVALGVILVCLGAFLFPLALKLTESTPPQVENQNRRNR
jgi:hypothetical protein